MFRTIRRFPAMALPLLFMIESHASEQFTFGVKGGVPLLNGLSAHCYPNPIPQGPAGSCYSDHTARYLVGPTVELFWPHRSAIEFDALYSRMGYHALGGIPSPIYPIGIGISYTSARVNSWEFPLMLKHRFSLAGKHPFIDVGPQFHYVNVSAQVTTDLFPPGVAVTTTTYQTDHPSELNSRFTVGFVIGGGAEFRAGHLRISPELRYARVGRHNFEDREQALTSNLNHLDFLLGITF
jgi:Outer membrane protein beta-barrel domain